MNKLINRLFPDEETKNYRKMHCNHRKELIKLAGETKEYDWFWLHEMIVLQIKHMYEYYSAGNNVWQSEETRLPTIEQLKHVLDLQNEIEQREDDLSIDSIIENENRIAELYEEIYSYIGKNIRNWWD